MDEKERVGICESCEEEKEVVEIEGHTLCKTCAEDIIRCTFCNRFIGINYDELEADNYGTLNVPELSLPDRLARLIFCNIDCLEDFLKKYKEELTKIKEQSLKGQRSIDDAWEGI